MSITQKTDVSDITSTNAKTVAYSGRKRHCLVPGCSRGAVSRGCCSACLMTFRRHVASGKTSWKRLINAGLVLPPYDSPRSLALTAIERVTSKR